MMKTKISAIFTLAILILNATGATFADNRPTKAKMRQSNALVDLLPASDGVATIDVKRFFNDALPKILISNQPMLGKILGKVNEMSNTTGIDLRKFDQIAVGVALKQTEGKNIDVDPVAVVRGDINAGAMLAVAKLASNGTYREEKIGDRSVFIFSVKDIAKKNAPTTTTSSATDMFDKAIDALSAEMAVTSLDRNTLVLGSLDRVKQTIDHQTTVGSDITELLSDKVTSVVTFAFRTPDGLAKFLPLDNDEFGTNVNAIRYLAGSMDVGTTGTSISALARTQTPENAKGLSEMLEGLQMIGKAILGNSKRPDQKVYGRLVENAKIELRGNDVTLELLVAQADINALVASIK